MKKSILALLMCVFLIVSVQPVEVAALNMDESSDGVEEVSQLDSLQEEGGDEISYSALDEPTRIKNQINDIYSKSKQKNGGNSFSGYCGKYVGYQLQLLGITNKYEGRNGKAFYDYFKGMNSSSGGASIVAYAPTKAATRTNTETNILSDLNLITNNGTRNAYNILLGFESATNDDGYGHVIFIHAIIDGTAYWSESGSAGSDFKFTEGEPIVQSISALAKYYGYWTTYEGAIVFTIDPNPTATNLTITANEASGVTHKNAVVSGFIHYGDKQPTEWGVDVTTDPSNWSGKNVPLNKSNAITSWSGTGRSISVNFATDAQSNPLRPSTTYYYRFWVKAGENDFYHSLVMPINTAKNAPSFTTPKETLGSGVNDVKISSKILWSSDAIPVSWGIDLKNGNGDWQNVDLKTAQEITASIRSSYPNGIPISLDFATETAQANMLKAGTSYTYRLWVHYQDQISGTDSFEHSESGSFTTKSASSVAVTGVSVSPTSATLNVGATKTLTATVSPSNASNKNVTWSSSNANVAKVSTGGVVTGVSAGSATITVKTADGNKTATCAVTVAANTTTAITIKNVCAKNGNAAGSAVTSVDKDKAILYATVNYGNDNKPDYFNLYLGTKSGQLSQVSLKSGINSFSDSTLSNNYPNCNFWVEPAERLSHELVEGTTYYYQFEIVSRAGESYWSEVKSFNTNGTAPTYAISYNANGGSNPPSAQTKKYAVDLTLSSTKPTRANSSAGGYTITLNANGGSVTPSSLTAERTNSYTFKYWNTAANGSGTSYNAGASYTANAAATLYAQWTSSTKTAAVTLPTPTRDGYTFKGWGTSSSATSGVSGSYTPNGNVTLYAIWQAVYKLDLNGRLDGTKVPNIEGYGTVDIYVNGSLVGKGKTDFCVAYPAGTKYEIKNIQATEGHKYNGVDGDVPLSGTITDSKVSVVLSFSTLYNVSYNVNGGSGTIPSQTKTHGTALTLSSTKPTRANASAGSYTVTLNANGGSVDKTSLTAARTTSYTFKNWNTAADGSGTAYNAGASYTANAAATLYAQWNSSTTTAALTLPTPTRDGYTFKGWATSSSATSGVTGSYTPSGNVTLYAVWSVNQLTMKYNTNGGTICSDSFAATSAGIVQKSGSDVTALWNYGSGNTVNGLANAATFGLAKNGYTFVGWSLSKDGSSTVFDQDDLSLKAETIYPDLKNGSTTVILYAIWQQNVLTLKYHANGGTVSSDTFVVSPDGIMRKDGADYTQIWKYGFAPKNGLSNATSFGLSRPGYTFIGWSAVQDGSGTVFDQNDATVTGEKINPALENGNAEATVYAIWEPIRYASILTLPAAMSSIEEEAFQDTAAEAVIVPDTVTFIADNAFDSGIVIIADRGSAAEAYASRNGLTFIDVEDYNG